MAEYQPCKPPTLRSGPVRTGKPKLRSNPSQARRSAEAADVQAVANAIAGLRIPKVRSKGRHGQSAVSFSKL